MSDPRPRDPFQYPATRILATLGPSSWSRSIIRDMVRAGASAFRVNFSHIRDDADRARWREIIREVRDVSAELRVPLAIVGDLCGPKLRTGKVPAGSTLSLSDGDEIIVTPDDGPCTPRRITVSHAGIASDVVPGVRVLLDDGLIELVVTEIRGRELACRVKHGGALGSNKGFNLPGVRLSVPAISEKDEVDLAFALEVGVDFIALSFVQEARDVADLKGRIARAGRTTPVISKIERPLAVENLEEILDVSDGIMVARGDLGVELGPEVLPMVQKEIILTARRHSKLVITATQMLDSMRSHPSPTRAEASDVANAIFDGTDVIMLSQESAVGQFPVLTVETMRNIAIHAESSELFRKQMEHFQRPRAEGVAHAAIRAACVAAEDVGARAVVPFSSSGWTAFCVSAWRPRTSIFACTHLQETYQRLALCWGIRPVLMPEARTVDDLYRKGVRALFEAGALSEGDLIVVLTGSVVEGSGANTIKIFPVEAEPPEKNDADSSAASGARPLS